MSFPPPSNDAPPPGSGGGFGPPQGFGPPPARGQYGPPASQLRAPGPPQRPSGGRAARVAAVLVGAVLVLAIVIGGIVWLGSGYDSEGTGAKSAEGGAAPSATTAEGAGGGSAGAGGGSPNLPGAAISGGPGADSSVAPADIPYVKLSPGTCFDSPGLDTAVNVVTKVPCDAPHDGEVISDEHLSGTLSSERQVQAQAIARCAPDARKRLKSLPRDGTRYYNYAFYPDLTTYETQGQDTVSCTLTVSDTPDGKQLSAPLS